MMTIMLLGAMSYGVDLAVLSMCNHTVLDYGTFGLWAALLAGGRIVLPTGKGQNMCKRYTSTYKYFLMLYLSF